MGVRGPAVSAHHVCSPRPAFPPLTMGVSAGVLPLGYRSPSSTSPPPILPGAKGGRVCAPWRSGPRGGRGQKRPTGAANFEQVPELRARRALGLRRSRPHERAREGGPRWRHGGAERAGGRTPRPCPDARGRRRGGVRRRRAGPAVPARAPA